MFEWNQLMFQNSMSPMMEEFILFHDYLMIILIHIISMVMVLMFGFFKKTYINPLLLENQMLEFIWTLVPAFILLLVAIPSLLLLYSMDSSMNSSMILKILGHQWYWSYEYSDFWYQKSKDTISFDSYMMNFFELKNGLFRLLETDNRVVLPYLTSIRILVSSSDVLHSWALPSLGIKLDATPGRLNQTSLFSYRPGIAYGQCSEICGANHSFMPITVEFISMEDFLIWVESFN